MLWKEPDTQVELTDGNRGEFTVLVDGHEVAGKRGETLPEPDEVLRAVREAEHAAAT